MKNLTIIKAQYKKDKIKQSLWINLSIKDIQILYYLIEIYHLWLKWELQWVEKKEWDYIHIYHTQILLNQHYPQIKKIRSSKYFSIKKNCDCWLLKRKMPDNNTSYIKPTELAYKYIRNYAS